MLKVRLIFVMLIMFAFTHSAFAGNESVKVQNKFKQYFNEMAVKVKQAADPSEKREIMNESFAKMNQTLDKIAGLSNVPAKDQAAILSLRNNIQDRYNELNGLKGYQKISDNQLNNYADYVQQNMEQADQWVTISVTTLLLVAILLILLVR